MEHLRSCHFQCRILRIKLGNVLICQPRTCIGITFYAHIGLLLGKQIQRIDVHIAIYQSNFSFCLLNQRNQQAERIINLPIKEDFLLRLGMVVDVPEHFVKALVRAFLIFKLFQFNIADTLKQKRIIGNKAAHLHKCVHNANRHLNRDIAAQYAGQHGNSLFRKGIRQIPTTTAPV